MKEAPAFYLLPLDGGGPGWGGMTSNFPFAHNPALFSLRGQIKKARLGQETGLL